MLQEELAPVLEFIAAGARPSLCSWDGSTLAERFERRVWAEELKVGAIYVRHFIGCDGLGHRWKAGDDVAFLAALWQALASEGSFCADCARALAAAPDEAAKGLGAEAAHAAENLRLLLEALALLCATHRRCGRRRRRSRNRAFSLLCPSSGTSTTRCSSISR